jgi:hypothetical protein
MATYLQNSTDLFPEIDYAAPNYQLMSTALGALTQRYNVGFNKLRTMYSSLLNSPVTNPETEKMRQMWFQKNNEQLKQYAHVDLSVSSNVSNAMSSFDPLVENKSFIADMNYTRQYQQQAQQINGYKNSTDEKVRKLYNPLMEEYVMRGAQELKKAKFDDIPNHGVRNYLAIEDPMSYLNAQAKEQGLVITREQGSGMYIVKQKNGEGAKKDFTEWASGLLGSGQYGEYYNRAASVMVDKMVDQQLQTTPGFTRDQALEQLGRQSLPEIYKSHENYTKSLSYNIAQIDKLKNSAINKYGNTVPPEVADQLAMIAERRKALQSKLDDAKKRPEAYSEAVQEVVQNYVRNPYGYQANLMRNSDSRKWADSYADVHSETEIRPDQVKLEMYQQSQQNARQARQFEHDLRKAALEHRYRMSEKIQEKMIDAQGMLTQGVNEYATENATPMEVYETDITTKVGESAKAMTSRDVLAVALNLPTEGSKVSGKIPGGSLGVLQNAIREAELNFYRGKPLSKETINVLNEFTDKTVGQKFRSFDQVQQIINSEVKQNEDHPLYKNATSNLSKGMRMMAEANKLYIEEQKTLAAHARSHPEHFKQEANGRWVRVGNHVSDPVLSTIVPNREKYTNAAGDKLPTLTYNVNPEKSGMSHVTRTVQQADNIGYFDATGKFNEFDQTTAQAVKNVMGHMGDQNLINSVDANVSITPGDRYKGKPMIRVTIPLKRSGEKGNLALGTFGLPKEVIEKAGISSSITFMVPASKAAQLGFNNKLVVGQDGSVISRPDGSSSIINTAQNSAEENPFASELLNLNRGASSVRFPDYMRIKGVDGAFSLSDGQVYITFYDKEGNVTAEEPTGVTEITPQTAVQLENAAEAYVEQRANAKHVSKTNANNNIRSQAKSDWVPINKIFN